MSAGTSLVCCARMQWSTSPTVGTSQVCSVAQIVKKIRAVSGIDFEIHQNDSRLRKIDRPFLAADIHRMSQYFGWRPERSIDDAIRDLWSNPDLAAV